MDIAIYEIIVQRMLLAYEMINTPDDLTRLFYLLNA